jgi:hypothetical protein
MEPTHDPRDPSRSHPSEETLENYALGRLPESEVAAVETHLLTCTACQESLTEADNYVSAMKAALEERHVAPAAKPSGSWLDWLRGQVRHPHPLTAFSMGAAALALVAVVSYKPSSTSSELVTLRSVRGGNAAEPAEGRAGTPLTLTIQSAEWNVDPTFRVRIVDARGQEVWTGAPVLDAGRNVVRLDGLGPGTYWVRLFSPAGSQLQEYGLRLQ